MRQPILPAKPEPKPEPEPEPIPDTEAVVEKPPEPVKQDFRFRAAPARHVEPARSETVTSTPLASQPVARQPEPRRPGFIAQVKQAIGVGDEETAATAAPSTTSARATSAPAASATPAATAGAAVAPAAVKPQEPAPVRPQATQPAAVRPQAAQPASRQPAAVKPALQQKRRVPTPQKPPDEPEYKPGDLICGNCGAGNDPARRFCRRCGTTLVDAVIAVKPPWYRRIFRRRQRALKAGERPKNMGIAERQGRASWIHRYLRLRRILGTLIILGAALGIGAYALLPNVSGQVNQAINEVRRMLIPQLEPIYPVTYDGPFVADHKPELAFDAYTTYWAADTTSGAPVLVANFSRKFDLAAVIFTTSPEAEHAKFDRPKTVELTFPGSDAKPITLTLGDDTGTITKGDIDARGIKTIEFHFIDFFPADQGGQHVVAVSDIQIRERK